MRTITIPGTALTTSELGFGCADLYREPSAGRRRRLLDAAYAAGIRHFDAAPMYGLGLAERELGRFARGRRDDVVIATKFGIAPTRACLALGRVQGPARRVLAAVPALRSRARSSAAGPASGRAGAALYRAVGFDAAAAELSLQRSLRELRTEHVDLLLMHDPEPGGVRSDDVCAYLERARDAGLIRAWGVAGEPQPALAVAQALPVGVPVLQVRRDILERSAADEACAAFAGRIVFGVLGRALQTVVRHVTADPARRRAWADAVGLDCAVPEVVARLVLAHALRENRDGVVLFSTIREDHLRSAAAVSAAGDGPGDEQLDRFARLVRDELHRPPVRSEATA